MRPPVRARCPIAWWTSAIGSELPEVARPSVTTTTVVEGRVAGDAGDDFGGLVEPGGEGGCASGAEVSEAFYPSSVASIDATPPTSNGWTSSMRYRSCNSAPTSVKYV
jgi:hypothetical protein